MGKGSRNLSVMRTGTWPLFYPNSSPLIFFLSGFINFPRTSTLLTSGQSFLRYYPSPNLEFGLS